MEGPLGSEFPVPGGIQAEWHDLADTCTRWETGLQGPFRAQWPWFLPFLGVTGLGMNLCVCVKWPTGVLWEHNCRIVGTAE